MIVVGNGQIGKTSMTKRFCKGAYSDEYKKTIGVDFLEKTHYVSDLGDSSVTSSDSSASLHKTV